MPKIEAPKMTELEELMNPALFSIWERTVQFIDTNYVMNHVWYTGGKAAAYELKFQRAGKTLISLFPKEDSIGLMIIFGKKEREKVETIRQDLPESVMKVYDEAKVFHDGKWVMWTLPDEVLLQNLLRLLVLKRKTDKQK